jgi:DNA-binding NarL/FixJ family response regulator
MPAVVLIDLSLPGKSGHDLLKWIQGRKQLQSLVRVVLSGSENPEDVDKSYRLGAHGYLMKPITAQQLNQPGRTLKTILLQMGTVPQPA